MIVAILHVPLHFYHLNESRSWRKNSIRQKQIPAKNYISLKVEVVVLPGTSFHELITSHHQ